MSLADVTSARSTPLPEGCPDCDTSASVTSDLHKYQVACTCKGSGAQYACADDPGSSPPVKTDTPPALPPRPPAAALIAANRRNNAALQNGTGGDVASCARRRKYAWWCVGCGALAAALGGLLAAAHILLRAYTASPHHLETVPAAVPAAMLVLTGVCIMSLARRRNRYSYMIKVVGACCLVCALTCVLVTITTTVIHMNKLQTLKFCEYTKLTRTCTCFSSPPDSQHSNQDEEGVRCVFEGVSDCGVVHGVLYWCLRGVFALSVTAVLVCIFSSMLAYQLLSHERKKMYWEQLELRCRSLYRSPAGQNATAGAGRPLQGNCSCCPQCHTGQPAWDISLQHRFWAPGRIGNLYSPNPGTVRKTSAWSWFPWPRSNSQSSRCRMGGVPQSGDSAYGFCDTSDNPQPQQNPNPSMDYEERTYPSNYNQPGFQRSQTMNFVPNPTAANFTQNPAGFQTTPGFSQNPSFTQSFVPDPGFGEHSGNYDSENGVWGPPPPYSPQGRSGSRHHLHHQDPATATLLHHHHIDVHRNSMPIHQPNLGSNLAIQNLHTCTGRNSYISHLVHPNAIPEIRTRMNPDLEARMNPDIGIYPPNMASLARLQAEMARMGEAGRFSTLRSNLGYSCQRSLGVSMGSLHQNCRMPDETLTIECLHQKTNSKVSEQSSDSGKKQGKENPAFQNDKHSPLRSAMQDPHRNQNTESEVYFADVSSCCNISVKADCCGNPNVSALVGTIENHPESTSESETGSFTLTRQQRPQPQIGSKRRPRMMHEKYRNEINTEKLNNSIRISELHSMSPIRLDGSRISESSRIDNDLRSSGSPNRVHMSPLRNVIPSPRNSPLHPRQSSSDSNVSHKAEYFVPPLPTHSPLTPGTEESLVSDEELEKANEMYNLKNEKPESSNRLGPDSRYDTKNEELRTSHHRYYSDTNTMDSGWQSGSEKHVTD